MVCVQDHWLPGFNFNVEEWDAKGLTFETLAICRSPARARAWRDAKFDVPLCSRQRRKGEHRVASALGQQQT
jgi:hypothetical protein